MKIDREQYEKSFGKATAPLFSFLDELERIQKLPYLIYFDNLFTSLKTLVELSNRGYGGTGTWRENRIPKSCPIRPKDSLAKCDRGTISFASDSKTNIVIAHWKDNKVVTVGSNCHSIHPIGECRRYCRQSGQKISVSCPNVIKSYNQWMGGTDRMDQNVSMYRTNIKGKKWYFPIFSWLIDVAIQNAWLLHRGIHRNCPLLEFRRRIALSILNLNGVKPSGGGRPPLRERGLSADVRFDNVGHYVRVPTGSKRRRCQGNNCSSVIRSECTKCNVGLCIPCFENYHKP